MADLASSYEAVARNLREFGYPDVTGAMVKEIHEAILAGNKPPHGVISMFARSQFEENPETFDLSGDDDD